MANHKDPARFLPLLLLLFAGSGFSALVYEIVWYQLLQLAIGSTAVSLGILLATFMGGLCLGSLGLPRLGWARQHPLRTMHSSAMHRMQGLALSLLSRCYRRNNPPVQVNLNSVRLEPPQ